MRAGALGALHKPRRSKPPPKKAPLRPMYLAPSDFLFPPSPFPFPAPLPVPPSLPVLPSFRPSVPPSPTHSLTHSLT